MNNVYIYDSSQIHVYETEDFGSIVDATTSTVDHGVKMFDYIVEDGTPGVVHDTLIVPLGQDYIVNEVTGYIDYEDVWVTETLYPVSGNINFSGGEENAATVVFVAIAEPIILRERAVVVRKQAWIGSGSLFEIGSGLERMVAPYIGGSGTLPSFKASGTALDSATSNYSEDAVITYGSDADYGVVAAAVGSSHDYGQVDGVTAGGETDFGTVVDLGGSNPFGLFSITGFNSSLGKIKSYSGSGSFTIHSGGGEQFDEPPGAQTYIVGRNLATGQFIRRDVIGLRFHGGNPEAFARVGYQGSGILFGFSSGDEAKVYDYTTESVVFVTDPIDNGTVDHGTGITEDYGQVNQQAIAGETDHGQVEITQTTQSFGLFKFGGGGHGAARSRDFVGSGSLSIAKHIDSYGEGQSSQIAFIPHYRSRGGIVVTNHIIPDAFAKTHIGSGSLFHIGEKTERAVFSYKVGLTSVTVPEILLAPWYGTSEYTESNISAVASGNGLGQSGGFNSSTTTYWRFTGQTQSNTAGTNPRILTLGPLDLTSYNQFEFTTIAGTSSNGGENCDADEDLYISYSIDGGTTYNQIVILDAEDERFTGSTFGLVTLDIPEAAKTSNVILKFHQEKHSGSAYDQWGIEYVKVLENTALGSGQVYTTIDSVDQGTVDQSAGTNENYGTITEPFTNGIQDYGQLNPASFKFGDIKISGGDSAHANPRAYRGAIERATESTIPPITILPDDLVHVASYNTVFDDVNVRNAGTGTGSVNGFNIGRHLAFEGGSTVDNVRSLTFEIDTREFDQMAITVIRGDGTNGGDAPEANENLRLWYSPDPQYQGGANGFLLWGTILAHDSTDGTAAPVRKVFNISGSFFNNENQRFSIRQGGADSGVDNYAITQIEFLNSAGSVPVSLFDLQPTTFSLDGGADIQFNEPATQVYTYGLLPNQASQGEFLKIGGGMSSIITVKGTYYTSGGFVSTGILDESAVFDYNDTSIATVETPVDNGLITATGSTSDYGQISEPGYGETDLGQVIITQTTQPFGKLFEWTGGDIAHANPVAYTGSVARVRITGGYSNLQFTSGAGESTALFATSGGDADSFSRPYIASGTLFSIGDRVERTAYSYNIDSIVEIEDPSDYGSITNTATQTIDNGDFFSYALEEDRGPIWMLPSDENPLGRLFEISGTAIEQFFPIFAWNKQSPPIRIFNDQQDPADFRFMPHWRGVTVGSPKLRNGPGGEFHTYAQSRPFIGGGRLFGLGDKYESATFRYTTESVVVVQPPENYGLVTDTPTQNLDYGSAGSTITPDGEFDNGQVIITETTQPLTGLYQFSGEGSTQFFRGPYVVKPTTIRIFNEQQDPADFRFSPHWRSRPYEQGKLTGDAETPRARDFVGEGRLFGIGDKVESATFRYTTGSIVVVEPPEDYGSVTNSSTQNIELGTISTSLTPGGETDFGQVIISETTQSATGLYKLSGDGATQFFRGPYEAKNGFIRFYKGQSADTDFRFMPHWRGVPDEQFKVSGIAHTPRARDFVGSGSLFHIGDRIEKAVFSYNSSSIEVLESPEEYGYVTNSATTTNDYGALTTTGGGDFDYGEVLISHTTQPFGLFRFRGGGHGAIKTAIPPTNTFELAISGSAHESFTSQGGESTVLFNINGNSAEKHTEVYVASGSLFHIGDRIERRTYSYNTSSIVAGTTHEDLGTVASTPATTEDYGSVTSAYLPPTSDYGDIVILPGSENPLGRLFEITGGDSGHKQTFAEFSSGSLFGASGAAEAAVWQTPEETFLFRTSGSAIEKHVENYVGTGNIKIKEETPLAPNAAVRFRPHWRSQHLLGTPLVHGNADVAFKGAYVSKGVFSRMYTHDKGEEWLRYRPSPRYVNSIYGQIGGSAFVYGDGDTRKISVYGYYGDDRDPGTSGSLFTFNSATEVAGFNPETETVLYKASGTAASKFNPHWRGVPDGSPRLFGTPELQLRFNIFTNPEGESATLYGENQPVITLSHFGSGSLFTAGSSAEVVGFNPFTDTRAFTFTGEPIVKINLRLFGGGQIFGFGGAAESATIDAPESTVLFTASGSGVITRSRDFVGSGTEFISGQAEENRTRAIAGEGSLFTASGSSEALTFSQSESTVLFNASGGERNAFVRSAVAEGSTTISDSLDESFARTFAGEGSLFSVGGAAESVTVDEESTGLFTFQGSAGVLRDRSFSGSGSLFSVGSAAEVASVAPEATGLFRISGDAETPFSRIFTGSGSTSISGVKDESFTKGNYDGEGSFAAFGGAAEVVGFNPAEETVLYEFNGNSDSTRARSFAGSGTATVHNDTVVPVITLNFVGEGSLSTFGGAAESRTIDVENTTLFEFRNGANESFTKGNYDAEGSATISGEATDIKLTRGHSGFAYVSAAGDSHDTRARAYDGSGSLFGLNSATVARAVDYNETSIGAQGEIVSTNLFRISGNNPGSVTRITQPTTAQFVTSGEAVSRLFLFSPPRKFGTII